MRKRRRAEITIETHQRFVLRGSGSSAQALCPECAAKMITPEHAATIANVSARAIYRWVESGRIHFLETPVGRLLVCLDSLDSFGQEPTNLPSV